MGKTKLLFVCLGNICRSPSGENIMNYLIEKEGLTDKFECDSAGTSRYHIGASPDKRMRMAAQKRGIESGLKMAEAFIIVREIIK